MHTLYLSNNLLATCEGLQQFEALRTLSLAGNEVRPRPPVHAAAGAHLCVCVCVSQVEDPSQLAPLRALRQLRALTLEGNPLSTIPHYRLHVLNMVPRLDSLDGHVRPAVPQLRLSLPSPSLTAALLCTRRSRTRSALKRRPWYTRSAS